MIYKQHNVTRTDARQYWMRRLRDIERTRFFTTGFIGDMNYSKNYALYIT